MYKYDTIGTHTHSEDKHGNTYQPTLQLVSTYIEGNLQIGIQKKTQTYIKEYINIHSSILILTNNNDSY